VIIERPALERRILASLDAGRIPVVLGPCGAGRTSLLLRAGHALGADRAQYLDFAAAATTPERCLLAIRSASPLLARASSVEPSLESPRAAFNALVALLDEASTSDGGSVTFLIDEILDVRTFENFPGLRHVQREIVERLAASPNRFVLASRFTARTHRLLRDAPARFEVIHVQPMETGDVQTAARLFNGSRLAESSAVASPVATLAAGRAGYVALLVEALSTMGPAVDPVAALAALMSPTGRMAARCRESYEMRLQRARGYGALKAILGILADHEPINLTEIAHHLHRTPGSTKDYLSWLEDVDLVTSPRKKYSIEDPMLKLYVRLYGRPVPPTDSDVVREVRDYAKARLLKPADANANAGTSAPAEVPPPMPAQTPTLAAVDRPGDRSGIIEID
jgi:hypothetical protein